MSSSQDAVDDWMEPDSEGENFAMRSPAPVVPTLPATDHCAAPGPGGKVLTETRPPQPDLSISTFTPAEPSCPPKFRRAAAGTENSSISALTVEQPSKPPKPRPRPAMKNRSSLTNSDPYSSIQNPDTSRLPRSDPIQTATSIMNPVGGSDVVPPFAGIVNAGRVPVVPAKLNHTSFAGSKGSRKVASVDVVEISSDEDDELCLLSPKPSKAAPVSRKLGEDGKRLKSSLGKKPKTPRPSKPNDGPLSTLPVATSPRAYSSLPPSDLPPPTSESITHAQDRTIDFPPIAVLDDANPSSDDFPVPTHLRKRKRSRLNQSTADFMPESERDGLSGDHGSLRSPGANSPKLFYPPTFFAGSSSPAGRPEPIHIAPLTLQKPEEPKKKTKAKKKSKGDALTHEMPQIEVLIETTKKSKSKSKRKPKAADEAVVFKSKEFIEDSDEDRPLVSVSGGPSSVPGTVHLQLEPVVALDLEGPSRKKSKKDRKKRDKPPPETHRLEANDKPPLVDIAGVGLDGQLEHAQDLDFHVDDPDVSASPSKRKAGDNTNPTGGQDPSGLPRRKKKRKKGEENAVDEANPASESIVNPPLGADVPAGLVNPQDGEDTATFVAPKRKPRPATILSDEEDAADTPLTLPAHPEPHEPSAKPPSDSLKENIPPPGSEKPRKLAVVSKLKKLTPMSELIRRANSHPASPFAAARSSSFNAYSPYAKSSRSSLSRIAPLHPNRRTPPPPIPRPPPPKKTKKQLEQEEKWEEELAESVEGWSCLSEEERASMIRAKRDREMGYED